MVFYITDAALQQTMWGHAPRMVIPARGVVIPSSRWRFIPVIFAMLGLIVLVSFVVAAPPIADRILLTWGVRPFGFPFLDLDTILSALRCRRLGFDVFTSNPCDALGRVFDYSPLWLAATVFPVTTGWIVPVGLAVDAMFVLSLLLLPPGRGLWQTAIITLCVVSTPIAFAMERANNDLIIFALAAASASLAARSLRLRLLGYTCALLAGLLKYYPLLALALICRERPRVFVPVAVAGVLLLLGFVAVEFEDLTRALPLIPVGRYFGDMFGVSTLPFGLADALGLPVSVAQMGLLVLVVASLVVGVRFGLSADLTVLTERERLFLLTGALLILGCFFTAQNIGYRALHLMLVVPAVTALATTGRLRTLYRLSVTVLVVLLWSECWRHALDAVLQHRAPWDVLEPTAGTTAQLLAWLLREFCWWWTVTLLAGLSFNLLLNSSTGRAMLPSLARLTRMRLQPA